MIGDMSDLTRKYHASVVPSYGNLRQDHLRLASSLKENSLQCFTSSSDTRIKRMLPPDVMHLLRAVTEGKVFRVSF